jgi:inhibitor of cysteine peptidase
MKKTLLLLAAVIFFSACAYPIMPAIVREWNNGKSIHVYDGDYIDVALNGNPTTGYDWYIDSKLPPVLKKISGPNFKTWSERIGAGGKVTYRFKAVRKGGTRLRLVYKRSWEKVPPIKTFSVNIFVR